jgi:hypothetical protein
MPDGGWEKVEFSEESFLDSLPRSPALPKHLHWSFDDAELAATGSNPAAEKLDAVRVANAPGVSLTGGKFGRALDFRGGGTIDTGWGGIGRDRSRTVAFWVRVPEVGLADAQVIGWGNWQDRNRNAQFSVRLTDVLFGAPGPGSPQQTKTNETRAMLVFGHCWFVAEQPLEAGRWHHIAAVYTGGKDAEGRPRVSLYIDAKPVSASYKHWGDPPVKIDTDTRAYRSSPLILGTSPSGNLPGAFAGELDELYIFNAPLSATEIYALAHPDGEGVR